MGYAYAAKAAATVASAGYTVTMNGDPTISGLTAFNLDVTITDAAALGAQRCRLSATVGGVLRRIRADGNSGYGAWCYVTLAVQGIDVGISLSTVHIDLEAGDIGKDVTITGTVTSLTPSISGMHMPTVV